MERKAIVFDFDGTIADTFSVALEIFYEITGRGEIPKGQVDNLRSATIRKAAAILKIPFWKAPFLLAKGRTRLAQRVGDIELFDEMPALLRSLHGAGYELHIISLNSTENINKVLNRYGLEDVFTSIEGKIRLRGKAHLIKRLMHRRNLQPQHVIYVGDEVRDIHAAHRAGIQVVSVSWGYNNMHILKEAGPDKLVLSPDDVTQAVEELA